MMTATFEKTLRFLSQTENPAAKDILRVLLDDPDWQVRTKAFDVLYLKMDQDLHVELLLHFLKDEERWLETSVVHPDRLARLADAAIRTQDEKLMNLAVNVLLNHRIYDGLKSLVPLLESPREDIAVLGATSIYCLAMSFYQELAACTSAVELRNFDRRREWFSEELEDAVRRFGVHGMTEPLQAFLIVTRKDYPSFLGVMADHHSLACKTILNFLETGDHGGYLRLLLSFIEDTGAPPQIDLIIAKRQDTRFIRYLLEVIGPQPSPTLKQALKRFKEFTWMNPDNPELLETIKGLEPNFVQLMMNISLPRERLIEMLRYVFAHCSPEGRRAAAESFRLLGGDDFNVVMLEAVNDPDPIVCSTILRQIKNRGLKEADQVIMQCVERPEPEVLRTIYELVSDFHIESYLQKVEQLPDPLARALGKIVKKVDPNMEKVLQTELASTAPVRRMAAIDAIRYTDLGHEFQDYLCNALQTDDETKVRIAACKALSCVLTVEAVQHLKAATEERSFAIREAALEAVQHWMTLYNSRK